MSIDRQPVELYRFSLRQQRWTHTPSAEPFVFDGDTYTPEFIRRSEISYTVEESRQGLEVTVRRDHPVAQLYASGEQLGTVHLTVLEADRVLPGTRFIWRGKIIGPDWRREGEGVVAVLNGEPTFADLQRGLLGLRMMPNCYKQLYGVLCRADRNAFREIGTVTAVSADGVQVQAQVIAGRPDGYWTGGWLETENVARRMILSHVGNQVVLSGRVDGLNVGTGIVVFPGCDHSTGIGGCLKFNNLVNFGGHKFVPKRNPNVGGL